jgi:serine/alanine racemase
MAIVVIGFHTNPFVNCTSKFVNELFMILADISVPFFFIISGFLMVIKWGNTVEEKKVRVNNMIISTVKLYTVWTLISLPLSIYGYIQSGNGFISCLLSYVKYFIFVGKLYNSYHLWYLLAFIFALAVIRLMLNKNKSVYQMTIVSFMVYIMFLVFLYMEQGDVANPILKYVVKVYEFIFNKGGIFSGMLYVCIGMCIGESKKYFESWLSLIVLMMGILIRYYVINEIGVVISASAFFMLVLSIKLPDNGCYRVLRDLSKYIYLTHLICFSIYTALIGDMNKLGIDSFIVTLALSLIWSMGIVAINKRRGRILR